MNTLEQFTGLYPVDKTLRFELRPIGKTLENIEKKGLITQDEQRNCEYEKVKDIIDRYHKQFINKCLKECKLKSESDGRHDSLEEYINLISKTEREKDEETLFDKIKANLRKQVVKAFKNDVTFVDLFKKELIQKHLVDFAETDEEKAMIKNFGKFTTYFTGFYENRQNMYSEEEKSTAIAYRLINENLPAFYDNMRSFEKITGSDVAVYFEKIEADSQKNLSVEHINEMFCRDYFSVVLTQKQIEVYNSIIGDINKYVNLYNQQQERDKSKRLPLLKSLHKMILSDSESFSRWSEKFGSDEEMLDAINDTINTLQSVLSDDDKDKSLKYLLQNMADYDLLRIYISNDEGLTGLSQRLFGRYDILTESIKGDIRENTSPKKKEKNDVELYEKRIDKLFKSRKSFSIDYLNRITNAAESIETYFSQLGAYDRNAVSEINLFEQIKNAHVATAEILAGKHTDLNQSETDIKLIKDLLDSLKSLQHFIKPLLGSGDEVDKDNEFYTKLCKAWDALEIITPLYNKVRAWLTRKPYSIEKIKLNFENPVLLAGWPKPETNSCVIFKENESIYYLGILANNNRTILCQDFNPQDAEDTIFRMKYLQSGKSSRNVQNLMVIDGRVKKVNGKKETSGPFAGKNIRLENFKNKYLPEEINRIRTQETYRLTNVNFRKEDLDSYINFYKQLINSYYPADYGFSFKESCDYNSFEDFTDHIDQQAYKIQFQKFSKKELMCLVNEGKLYLFQIWSKDFSEYSKGTPNLHTIYWRMLFDEENLANVVYKLNGGAELFFRRKSLDLGKTTIHKAHQPVNNKNIKNDKRESVFNYDIIKNRRYTIDQFQFHVPITINFKATGNGKINNTALEAIRAGKIEHIIGIDRGERHLLYLSLIDLKGNIIKQFALNDIVNEYNRCTYTTNYKDLLVSREGDRKEARRNWQKIENIKEIKEGYLSQVVYLISRMMIEYKAIVVLEDLNMGFMRGRQKIERQVYQKFEKMLIDKLNCYIDKQKDFNDIGGALHPLQLTSKFESFRKLENQSGWLFYIPAWNTSKIDPVTGFVNMLDTRYENVEKAHEFFAKFDTIRYNRDKDLFEFSFDYDNFTEKARDTRTKWILCTYGTRIRMFRNSSKNNQWASEEVVLTDEFKKFFVNVGIDINSNLKEDISSLTQKEHLETLMRLMTLLLQMRNSKPGTEIDYLLSPVADADGSFYDSRKEIAALPKDADANGAYNIARKGLWAIHKIKSTSSGEMLNLAISNKEWLRFAQQKPYLNE